MIAASCPALLLQVAAEVKMLGGTVCGSRVEVAGLLKARAVPIPTRHAYTSHSGPTVYDSSANPKAHSASSTCVTSTIRLRLYWSATCPPGSESRITGVTCASPTSPSAKGLWVRNHNSQPTANDSIWSPSVAMKRPASSRRKSRKRRAAYGSRRGLLSIKASQVTRLSPAAPAVCAASCQR